MGNNFRIKFKDNLPINTNEMMTNFFSKKISQGKATIDNYGRPKLANPSVEDIIEIQKMNIVDYVEYDCVLCGKIFRGYGNNPTPVKTEGRCCDDCNIRKVVPVRLEEQTKKDINASLEQNQLNQNTWADINSDKVFYNSFGIQDNDRLKNYQLMKSYWVVKMGTYTEDDWIGKENMALLKAMWNTSFKASLDEAKVFVIEEDVVPLLLHTESEDGNFPFPSTFIDATVQVKNRTYHGFHIGSYYTDKTQYKSILTTYTKIITHKGNKVRFIYPDYIMLKKSNDDDTTLNEAFRKNDYYHNKIKHFCFSFCSFINETDVREVKIPLNPKNNIRRIDRGAMPLPEHINVVIHGKLRQYVDKVNSTPTGTSKKIGYSYWVRGFYRHFKNKKRYAKLYSLSADDMKEAGLTWSDKFKGILRKWVKPQRRGSGILIKQSWEVKE